MHVQNGFQRCFKFLMETWSAPALPDCRDGSNPSRHWVEDVRSDERIQLFVSFHKLEQPELPLPLLC